MKNRRKISRGTKRRKTNVVQVSIKTHITKITPELNLRTKYVMQY